ncbi:polysaccharide biosynthesis protein [Paenibacillus cisolokensis]|uniref:putative polysaccharide biosynthesis protein n=1 Tax=Paenibacillus cisolokensis TaxID=1658519 RepID=UPI003D296D60
MSKKETFIKGTIILAVAALVARVLGIAQRVPLEHMLNDVGQASFNFANTLYLMLLTVATAGIPSTLSKMISERHALNKPAEARRVYQAALLFAAAAGVIITVLLYFAAPYYATYVAELPEAAPAIQALAPALLLFPAIAMMRGYFQGRNNMTAGGLSQIVEQIARVVTAIGLAYLLLRMGYDDKWVAAGASFGGVLGSIGAFAVMLYFAAKLRRTDREANMPPADRSIPLRGIYKAIFTLSIPIVLSSMAVPAVNFIDNSIVKPLLTGPIGAEAATAALAVLGTRAQSVAGIPPILAIALSTSLIPIISAAYARKDQEHLEQQVTMAMRVAIMTGMPVVIALCTAAYSINGLLFSNLEGTGIIAFLTFGTILQITMMTTNSILLGIGKAKLSMVHVMVGVVVKLAASFLLAPLFGIYGIIGGTAICFLVITALNLRSIKAIVAFSILGKRWVGFALTVLVSGLGGYGLNQAGIQLVHVMPSRLAFLITCLIVGVVVVVVYLVLMVMFGVLRQSELASYPRPLQKLFRPLMKLQPARLRERG